MLRQARKRFQRTLFPVVQRTILCNVVLLLPSFVLTAQSRVQGAPAASIVDVPRDTALARDTLATQLATITTDTGAFTPGLRNLTSFTIPGLCLATARLTRATFQLSLAAQAIEDTLRVDTLGVGAAVPIARTCGSHFSLKTTAPRDLADLFSLSVYMQNDSLAQAVLATRVAQVTTEQDRETLWIQAMQTFLQFGRQTAATTLMTQVDAHGPATREAQIAMHEDLGHLTTETPADTARVRQELLQVLRLVAGEPHSLDHYLHERAAYYSLMELTVWGPQDSVSVLARQVQRSLARYHDNPEVTGSIYWEPWPSYTEAQAIIAVTPGWYSYQRRGGRVIAPRLQADIWFPVPGQSTADTVRPVPGKVNVICLGGKLIDRPDEVFRNAPLLSGYQQAATIRRWLAVYGPANLAVTLVWPIAGYLSVGYGGYKDINSVRLFQTPTEEAQLWRWYTQDYDQLPVLLAMQHRHDQWLPAPDGRRLTETKLQVNELWTHDPEALKNRANERASGLQDDSVFGLRPGERDVSCAVIGRDGMVEYTTNEDDWKGSGVDVVLKWLFHGPTAAADSTPKSPTSSLSSHSSSRPAPGVSP